jgi:hypothetical protein
MPENFRSNRNPSRSKAGQSAHLQVFSYPATPLAMDQVECPDTHLPERLPAKKAGRVKSQTGFFRTLSKIRPQNRPIPSELKISP